MTIMEASPTKESDLFKGVSQRVLNEIGRKGEEMFFNKDSIIFSAEEEAAYIYELAEGTVDIVVSERDNMHYSIMRPNEIFGWSALVEPYVYTATARCTTDVKVVRIARDVIEDAVKHHPAEGLIIYKHLAGLIGQRLRSAYQYIYRT